MEIRPISSAEDFSEALKESAIAYMGYCVEEHGLDKPTNNYTLIPELDAESKLVYSLHRVFPIDGVSIIVTAVTCFDLEEKEQFCIDVRTIMAMDEKDDQLVNKAMDHMSQKGVVVSLDDAITIIKEVFKERVN